MSDLERIWNASLNQLKAGYVENVDHYTCVCCAKQFEKGIIYPEDGVLYEAGKYTRLHIEKEHQSVFAYLIGLDKSVTGLSQLQRGILSLFYQGKSDAEVQKELGVGSTSTIRNHRFVLREKERQARVFLAIMELLRAKDDRVPADGPDLPAVSWQNRSRIKVSEQDKVIQKYFPFGTEGPLASFSMPHKQKLIIVGEVAKRFATGRTYTEKEVNDILQALFADYVTLRRYLIDCGFMNRLPDGSEYWRTDSDDGREDRKVDRKRELKRLAKETETVAGVYQIKNNRNGKILIESTSNLKTINGRQFELENGSYLNQALQREWNEFGKDTFTFEVLEVLEKPETGYFDERDALAKLKAKWLDQLQPFADRGYNPTRGNK